MLFNDLGDRSHPSSAGSISAPRRAVETNHRPIGSRSQQAAEACGGRRGSASRRGTDTATVDWAQEATDNRERKTRRGKSNLFATVCSAPN